MGISDDSRFRRALEIIADNQRGSASYLRDFARAVLDEDPTNPPWLVPDHGRDANAG